MQYTSVCNTEAIAIIIITAAVCGILLSSFYNNLHQKTLYYGLDYHDLKNLGAKWAIYTSKVVEDFKCAFQNLDRDVEALEGIESLVATQERENEMKIEQNECEENDQLNSIESLLEEKKKTTEAIHSSLWWSKLETSHILRL